MIKLLEINVYTVTRSRDLRWPKMFVQAYGLFTITMTAIVVVII